MPRVNWLFVHLRPGRHPGATMYPGEGCLRTMYGTKEISDLHPLWFNDIGRPCDEAVSFGVFDKVALA